MTDVHEEYATLLADVLALLQSYQQSGGRLLPVGKLDLLTQADGAAPPEAPRSENRAAPRSDTKVSPASRPESRSPDPRVPPRPAESRPAEAPPARPAAGWARYMRDPVEEIKRFQAETVGDCQRCGRCQGRSFLFGGQGNPKADLVIIVNSPTEEEEYSHQLMIGPSGEMFDNMLVKVLQTSREKVFILPALLCRSRGKPDPKEVETCRPLIEKQVELIKPKVVMMMGAEALALLGPEARRGEWGLFGGVEVMPTWHPAEILQDASRKRAAFQHLQQVQPKIGQMSLFGRP